MAASFIPDDELVCCEKCQEKFSDLQSTICFKCPNCEAAVAIDLSNTSKLPSSFFYISLIKLFDAVKLKVHTQNQEQPTEEGAGCSKPSVEDGCPKYSINNRDEAIQSKKSSRLTIEPSGTEVKRDVNTRKNIQAMCKEKYHENSPLELYCKTCEQCICQKCSGTTHNSNDHNKVTIKEQTEDVKKLVGEDRDRLNELLIKYKRELDLSKENMERIKRESKAKSDEICEETQAYLIRILIDHAADMVEKVYNWHIEQQEANKREVDKINDNIKQVKEQEEEYAKIMESDSEHFILESYQSLQQNGKTPFRNDAYVLSTEPVKRNACVQFILNPEAISLLKKLKIGEIKESVTDPSVCFIESVANVRCGFTNDLIIVTKNSEGDVCHTDQGSIKVQIQSVDGSEVQRKELVETETGRFLVQYKAEIPSPYKVVVRIAGEEIKNSPQKIETIDARADFTSIGRILIDERETEDMSFLSSIAVNERSCIAVVNNHHEYFRVKLFNAGGKYLRDIGGQLSNPYGVIFNDDKLLICDNANGCGYIKEFGIDGTYKGSLCIFSQGVTIKAICRSVDQNIACLGYHHRKKQTFIKLLDKQNCDRHLSEITLKVPDNIYKEPFSLAYDNNKYFVSFCRRVDVFDEKDGCLLYTFGKKGSKEGQFGAGVRGLSIFGNEMLLVCDTHNHRVQVFSQDGQFIRSFGSKGGEEPYPFDVDVASDGRVFVLRKRQQTSSGVEMTYPH